ncbi:nitronate monooxygenase [Coralliovum pocilloporae]|uniref:nitronate monooxygenase n=1 Tax=Coralliovum pocilloporae TaxID=3066369 RepID=UPI003306F748
MAPTFIFMLTRNDRTVKDAMTLAEKALSYGVRHIGFKDIGLPFDALYDLNRLIRRGKATSYLEVVSLDESSELLSARAARDLGVDVLLGGTRADRVTSILKGTGIRYYPFPGAITGHPSELEGTIDSITRSAEALANQDGVHGLDLLAYRFKGDVPELMASVCKAVSIPVIMAGSIDSAERIRAVQSAGAAGFTIGTAILEGCFDRANPEPDAQLKAVQAQLQTL